MKKFFLRPEDFKRLISPEWGSCFITDRVTVNGCKIGYMYREKGDHPGDSGWRFFAGDETQEYVNDLSHTGLYAVNTAANYDPDIIPYLSTPAPCAFEKISGERTYREV